MTIDEIMKEDVEGVYIFKNYHADEIPVFIHTKIFRGKMPKRAKKKQTKSKRK